jgi:hypothetical protein
MQYLNRAKEIIDEFQKVSHLPVDLEDICFEIKPAEDHESGRRFFLFARDFNQAGAVEFEIKCVLGTIDDPKACVKLALLNGRNCGYKHGLFACALRADPSAPPFLVLARRMAFAPSTSAREAGGMLWAELFPIIRPLAASMELEVPEGISLF